MEQDVYAPYRAKYALLCQKRDALNDTVADKVAAKEDAARRSAEANDEANTLAAEIQAMRGGQSWVDLKKEIGALAKMISGK